MKKKLLFVIVACAFFLPATVFAAKAPKFDESKNLFFANGTPITIEERTDGQEGALIKWDGGEQLVPVNTSVFAGSHNSDEAIETASITMNGGTVKNIIGGGLHKSIVKKATVVMNNGTVTGSVMGGGAHHLKQTGDGDFIDSSVAESKDRTKAITIVDETTVTINGGTVKYAVWGGGESYSYTGKSTVTINNVKTNYAIAGGSNGYTGDVNFTINGGEISTVQGVNRGEMDTITTTINGGKINAVYAAGDSSDAGVDGIVNEKVSLKVFDGEIATISAGTSGGPNSLATDLVVAEINSKFEDKIGQDFDQDATTVTVNLMLIAGNEGQTIQIPRGTVFTTEELKAMIEEINNELAADNLELVGFYLDEELTQEFDFSTPIERDMELYMKLKDVTPEQKVENPETSDVNIFLILSLVAVGAFGTTLVLKNRLS